MNPLGQDLAQSRQRAAREKQWNEQQGGKAVGHLPGANSMTRKMANMANETLRQGFLDGKHGMPRFFLRNGGNPTNIPAPGIMDGVAANVAQNAGLVGSPVSLNPGYANSELGQREALRAQMLGRRRMS